MPVLSETNQHSYTHGLCSHSSLTYLFLLSAVVLLSYTLLKRRKISRARDEQQLPSFTSNEKDAGRGIQEQESSPSPISENFQRPPQPPPFTPPTPLSTSNQEYYTTTTSAPMQDFPPTATFTDPDFEFTTSPISTSPQSSPQFPQEQTLPRRRSYTKQTPSGSEVTGEIIISSEGWRRHTRVFGGGVCKACEESDRRMSA